MRICEVYFSPTGGTKKVGDCFCEALGKDVERVNLGEQTAEILEVAGELIVVVAPVFGGRIPSVVTQKLQKMNGEERKAVAIVVYGNRAYDDALLELKDMLEGCNCHVIGAGAFVARHSIVPEVGKGRPDDRDIQDIYTFAQKVLESILENSVCKLAIPGNKPYKDEMNMPITPQSLDTCIKCGRCKSVCPTGAISQENNNLATDAEKCILCMACVADCPHNARVLPSPVAEQMEQVLGALKAVRGVNEYFL